MQLWPQDWVKQMRKMDEMVGMKNCLDNSVGKKRLVCPFISKQFWKYICCIISKITYLKKGQKIWGETPNNFVRRKKLNYTDIFVETYIEISYVVISIVLITVMLIIEIFYLSQICSFLGYYFEKLPLFIPIALYYILHKF